MTRPDGSLPTPPRRALDDPFYALRRVAALAPTVRLGLETERAALEAALDDSDREFLVWFEHRRALLARALELHDELWPRAAGHARRPPKPDERWLPPLPCPARRTSGAGLRISCQAFLQRFGTCSLVELHMLLHAHGYEIDSAKPVQALADALGYEADQGRCDRVDRGVYRTRLQDRPPTVIDPPLVTPSLTPDDLRNGPTSSRPSDHLHAGGADPVGDDLDRLEPEALVEAHRRVRRTGRQHHRGGGMPVEQRRQQTPTETAAFPALGDGDGELGHVVGHEGGALALRAHEQPQPGGAHPLRAVGRDHPVVAGATPTLDVVGEVRPRHQSGHRGALVEVRP